MIADVEKKVAELIASVKVAAGKRTGFALKSFARAQWSVIVDQHPELAVYRRQFMLGIGVPQ